jgi:hypothetical protein
VPLFGKRKAEQQQNTATRKVLEDAQATFKRNVRSWFERLAELQADTASPALTDEILAQAGEFPRPSGDSLTDLQQVYIVSYARSFVNEIMERKTIHATVAAHKANETGSPEAGRLQNAAQF